MTLNSVSLALVLTFIPSSVMAQTDPVQEPGLELVTDRPDQTESSVVIPPPGILSAGNRLGCHRERRDST